MSGIGEGYTLNSYHRSELISASFIPRRRECFTDLDHIGEQCPHPPFQFCSFSRRAQAHSTDNRTSRLINLRNYPRRARTLSLQQTSKKRRGSNPQLTPRTLHGHRSLQHQSQLSIVGPKGSRVRSWTQPLDFSSLSL